MLEVLPALAQLRAIPWQVTRSTTRGRPASRIDSLSTVHNLALIVTLILALILALALGLALTLTLTLALALIVILILFLKS